jgi:DedD protein
MGLFSFFSKNKQGRAAEDSGRFYSKDDDAAIGERARAKRASNAGGAAARRSGNDPMLPEKKRARRRLVGAIALALAAAVGLPMLLDSEPKPLAGDIAIQIPSKDKAAPLPVPGEPGASTSGASPGQPAAADKAVAAEDSVDKDEEIIEAPPSVPAKADVAKAKSEPKPESRADSKSDTRIAERAERAEHERADKQRADRERADRERAERAERAERERTEKVERPARERADKAEKAEKADRAARLEKLRAEEKARQKADDKPVKPVPAQGAAHSDNRAVAILEGKGVDRAVDREKAADAGGPKVTLQVAAMSSQEKAADLQARLRGAGISSHTEKFGDLIRVKVGPLSKDEAASVRAKLSKLGL